MLDIRQVLALRRFKKSLFWKRRYLLLLNIRFDLFVVAWKVQNDRRYFYMLSKLQEKFKVLLPRFRKDNPSIMNA